MRPTESFLRPARRPASSNDGFDLEPAPGQLTSTAAAVKPSTLLPGISVFLPAHNEEGNIGRVVGSFLNVLPGLAERYEVIVVDDGSSDQTAAIAQQLAEKDSRVRVVRHERNRGYGAAVISGLCAAREPFVVLCDGDGQFDARDLALFTARAGDFDVIMGRRTRRADPLMRRINGRAWTMFMRLLFGLKVSDIDCGFKLFRRSLLEEIELKAQGAMISTELVARLAARRARFCEADVRHLPRVTGEQSGASFKVIFRAFRELFKLYRDLRNEERGRS